MNRKLLAILCVGLLVGLAGCATISVTSDVNSDGTIERYEMNISTSTTVYGFLNQAAVEEGYDSFEDQIKDGENISSENFEYEETIDGNDATIRIAVSDINASGVNSITVREEDGQLVYKDETFVEELNESTETTETSEDIMSGLVLEYRVNMPGEITSSNADEVDGSTATWTRTGSEAFSNTSIQATSEAGSALSTPGFGVSVALVAILSLIAAAVLRRE